MGSRRKAREQALQVLYQIDLAGHSPEGGLESFRAHYECSQEDWSFVKELVEGTMANLAQIDEIIEKNSDHWKISRMPRIDRNILRLGVFELTSCQNTPGPVIVPNGLEKPRPEAL